MIELSRTIATSWEEVPSPDVDVVVFVARLEGGTDAQSLIVVPENIGITKWREEESKRMAADLGWPVVVMSPYSRLGGNPPAGPFETQEERRRAAFLAMPDEQVARDLDATVAWTREQSYTNDRLPALLGFCSGGGQALYSVCTRRALAACLVSIYGNVVLSGDFTEDRQPIDRIPSVTSLDCPFQLHAGTEDFTIPEDQLQRLEAELPKSGQPYEIHRYPGANHIFADGSHPNYDAKASAELWPRVYDFLNRYTDPANAS